MGPSPSRLVADGRAACLGAGLATPVGTCRPAGSRGLRCLCVLTGPPRAVGPASPKGPRAAAAAAGARICAPGTRSAVGLLWTPGRLRDLRPPRPSWPPPNHAHVSAPRRLPPPASCPALAPGDCNAEHAVCESMQANTDREGAGDSWCQCQLPKLSGMRRFLLPAYSTRMILEVSRAL